MPHGRGSLSEAIEEALRKQRERAGLRRTLGEAARHPIELTKGATVESIKDIFEAIGGSVTNIAQAVSPVAIPGATDKPIEGFSPLERFGAISNAALMGIPDAITRRAQEITTERGEPQTTGEAITRGVTAVGKTALMDILPGQELANLVSGEIEGRPITAEEVGENITRSVLKMLPFSKLASKLFPKTTSAVLGQEIGKVATLPEQLSKTVSLGEIESGVAGRRMSPAKAAERLGVPLDEAIKEGLIELKGEKGGQAILTDKGVRQFLKEIGVEKPTTEPLAVKSNQRPLSERIETLKESVRAAQEQQTIADVAKPTPSEAVQLQEALIPEQQALGEVQKLLTKEETRAIVRDVMQKDIFRELIKGTDIESEGFNINIHVAEAVKRGALNPELALQLAEKYQLPLSEVAAETAAAVKRTATYGGSVLEPFSEAAKQFYAEQVAIAAKAPGGFKGILEALKGNIDPEVARATDFLQALEKAKDAPIGVYQKAVHLANRGIERTRRALIVSQLKTASRNVASQGATSVVEVFEHAITGLVQSVFNLPDIIKGGKNIGDFYGDLQGDISAFIHRLPGVGRKNVENLLMHYPLNRERLLSGSAFDISSNVLNSWIKGGKKTIGDAIDIGTELVTTFTRLQEREFRIMNFQARLEGNMRVLGYKGNNLLDQAIQLGKREDLPDSIRLAVADAEDFALKQTFAQDFKSGFAGALLDFYKKVPFMTALGPTFPRFMINSWRWQLEHSPTHLFNIFDKTFRDQLFGGLEGGFESAQARRTMAKGMSGLAMMNAAYAVQNSEHVGPRYYQINSGRKDEKGDIIYNDTRPYQPFDTYMFLARAIKTAKENRRFNDEFTLDDITNAMTNIRRTSDIPLFAVQGWLRNLQSDDMNTVERVFTEPLGQWLGSFFIPGRTIQDFRAAAGSKDAAVRRDIRGQELTGPTQTNIPGLAEELPALIDPLTGKSIIQVEPGRQQFTGVGKIALGKMGHMIEKHQLTRREIIGEHYDARANNLVAEELGTILNTKVKDKGTLRDLIAEQVGKLKLSNKLEKETIKDIFQSLREDIIDTVSKKDLERLMLDRKNGIKNPARWAFAEAEVQKAPASEQPIVKEILKKAGLY